MTITLPELEEVIEGRVVRLAPRPITFAQFLEMGNPKESVELVNGVLEEKPMTLLDHELTEGWLYSLMGAYAQKRGLGRMFHSRLPVPINAFGGRLPDLMFVRQEQMRLVEQKAMFGVPDLIIEVVSPNDRPCALRALEADYCTLGVPEILFVNTRLPEVRILRKRGDTYEETSVTSGPLTFDTVPGLTLQAEWILHEPRPDVYDTLTAMLFA